MNMRKTILVSALVVGLFSPFTYEAHAETTADYEYRIDGDHAVITGYTGSETNLVIPDEIGGYTVTEIGPFAFDGNDGILTVAIGNNVTAIGENAFNSCHNLANVSFPASLTAIGDNAFFECMSLASLNLPDSLLSIGDGAFFETVTLTEVVIPENVEHLGRFAFASWPMERSDLGNSHLKRVVFAGNRITEIPDQCFQYCSELESVRLGGEVTSIGVRAFYECNALKEINFPSSLQVIGDFAFYSCISLPSLDLSVSKIGESAFARCTKVSSVSIPNITSIGPYAFHSTGALRNGSLSAEETSSSLGRDVKEESSSSLKNVTETTEPAAKETDLIPEEKSTEVSEKEDQENKEEKEAAKEQKPAEEEQESVSGIPAEPSAEEESAALELSDPEENTEPEASEITEEPQELPSEEPAAEPEQEPGKPEPSSAPEEPEPTQEPEEEKILPKEGVTQAEENSHEGSEKEDEEHEALQVIEEEESSSLAESDSEFVLRLPAHAVTLAERALGSNYFTKFEVAEGNPSLHTDSDGLGLYEADVLIAFARSGAPVSYAIKEGTVKIGPEALASSDDQPVLKEITFPASLREIGDSAFSGCFDQSLTSLIIPEGVERIGDLSFSGNSSLTGITLPNSLREIGGYAFSDAANLTSVTFGNGLESIGNNCFYKDNKLTGVKLPSSIKQFGRLVFPYSDKGFPAVSSWGNLSFDGLYISRMTENGRIIYDYLPDSLGETLGYIIPDDTIEIKPAALASPSIPVEGEIIFYYLPEREDLIIGDHAVCSILDSMEPQTMFRSAIISRSQAALDYANKYGVACFSDVPDLNFTSVTLHAGESSQNLTLSNARTPVHFFSSDKTVAEVSEDGVITGVSKGKTYVIAASQSFYRSVEVTVTDGEYVPVDPSRENSYLQMSKEYYPEWLKDYNQRNPIALKELENASVLIYTGNAYQAMAGLHYLDGYGDASYLESRVYHRPQYGHTIDQFRNINHNMDMQASRGDNGDQNLIVYSGTPIVYPYTGAGNSLEDLLNSVGNVITFEPMISTSLSGGLASMFAGITNNGTMLEIYLPCDLATGLYVDGISANQGEFEILLESGMRFQILEAGIRKTDLNYLDGDPRPAMGQRYLKLLALKKGQEKVTDFDPYIVTKPVPEPPAPTPTPTPKPKPGPASDDDDAPSPAKEPGYVITCQMAGYPAGYAWNEAAKACQPGTLDENGVFHAYGAAGTAKAGGGVPNTYDKGLGDTILTLLISSLAALVSAVLLKKYS